DYRSLMVLPLNTQTRGAVGALTLVRTGAAAPFDEASLLLAQDLSRRCATAIGKAMLYDEVVRVATVFQKAALPSALPAVPGISFDAYYEPSSENMLVGGDWYDAFPLEDGRIAITVGDVLGHGLEAATWMSRLRNGFRAALFADVSPTRALEVVDRMLQVESREGFTTAVVALVDPIRSTLTCASAGHPGPLLWNGSGTITDPFEDRGLPLGFRNLGPVRSTSQTLDVRAGSFAAFFTDGLLEWNRDIAGAWKALHTALLRQDIREAAHPAEQLRSAVVTGSGHSDDIAVLTVRWDAMVSNTA
ncbi:MAG TPA: PP2C family protein-serine/threonine phosphatase, partial [Candidatus Baltobacteraceae bacterium]|nr:PP2C family protein-serine/threonine phosphatase [Candidatus Baltobacteraceae bacterium]